jgi:hypothetical protein
MAIIVFLYPRSDIRYSSAMRTLTAGFILLLSAVGCSQRVEGLKASLGDQGVSDDWIYEDIKKGYAESKKTGKPLLVVFR